MERVCLASFEDLAQCMVVLDKEPPGMHFDLEPTCSPPWQMIMALTRFLQEVVCMKELEEVS